MIQIHVRLHGALRDKLPPKAKGRAILVLPDGSPITSVFDRLSLHRRIVVAVNEKIVDDWNTILQDGDAIEIFRLVAGGMRTG